MIMNKLLFPQKNLNEMNRIIKNPTHAILIIGKYGYGKRTAAGYLGSQLLTIGQDDLINYPYFYVIEPENKLISIEKIRELKKLFQLKTTGKNSIRRVVILEDADTM